MKTLLILRHGKSSWDDPDLSDHERPLKKRGKRDAPRMGELLKQENLVPDLIISSTAERARRTAELASEASGYRGQIQHQAELYHGAPEDFIGVLIDAAGKTDCVMVVGHNPGLEELLTALTGIDAFLPTAALAQVSLPIANWDELRLPTPGQLENLWRPREL